MKARQRILVVDDEPNILRTLAGNLRAEGYDIATAWTGEQALTEVRARPPAAIVLDLALPDIDGNAVCRSIRAWADVPILILSATVDAREKVAALDAGADDYVTKPFAMEELLARLRAITRRVRDQPQPLLEIGDLRIDLEKRAVFRSSERIRLTPTEFALLRVLALNEGKLLTHGVLLRQIWGSAHAREAHSLRVYVSQLRRKLERDPARPEYLLTEPYAGYRLVRPPTGVG